jgi:hypothetical protein
MKNREPKLQHFSSYPTTAELYALERAAKAARAVALARLARAAVTSVKNFFSVKGLRHA